MTDPGHVITVVMSENRESPVSAMQRTNDLMVVVTTDYKCVDQCKAAAEKQRKAFQARVCGILLETGDADYSVQGDS